MESKLVDNVIEVKIVLPNGLSLSLATEWIENDSLEHNKPDCELKAFNRLSEILKKSFPRLMDYIPIKQF